ncbi:MAG: hypothetical protein EGR77_05570 [Pseudobutyrivibrio sp.]|nr:hypothetical protein [Pseudobutyrivibrio sp.]
MSLWLSYQYILFSTIHQKYIHHLIQQLKKHKKIYVISESQDTCVVYGMPRSIEQQGLSDKVVPINQVADAIIKKLGD